MNHEQRTKHNRPYVDPCVGSSKCVHIIVAKLLTAIQSPSWGGLELPNSPRLYGIDIADGIKKGQRLPMTVKSTNVKSLADTLPYE
jgi:hypothetical protein